MIWIFLFIKNPFCTKNLTPYRLDSGKMLLTKTIRKAFPKNISLNKFYGYFILVYFSRERFSRPVSDGDVFDII